MLTPEGNQIAAQALFQQASTALVVISDGSATVEAAQDEGFPRLGEDGVSVVFLSLIHI